MKPLTRPQYDGSENEMNHSLWLLISGSLVLVVPGVWVQRRARHEFEKHDRLSTQTFVVLFVALVGHAGITLLAAWNSMWPLPIDRRIGLLTGGVAAAVGATVYVAARVQFRSFRLTWGLDSSRLVTSGIYRLSRNPQTVGAVLFWTGTALLGGSGVALLLVTLLCLALLVWLPVEEQILERKFGQDYRHYRKGTPRFLGLPRRQASHMDA